MTVSQVAVRKYHCQWKIKTKINKKRERRSGFASPWLIVAAFLVFSGIYVYCINGNATKGYQIKKIEKEIEELKKENENLLIKEAELKSLYRIEESTKKLNMAETVQVSFIEEKSPVAMK